VEDRERFLAAIRKASETVEDPRGPIKLDESGNPTQNVYILKVERVDGKLANTVVQTYPMVSQFWTYKPDDFLKLPAYSRDYPPARPSRSRPRRWHCHAPAVKSAAPKRNGAERSTASATAPIIIVPSK